MNIEWLRDLVICIFGLGAMVAIICIVVLAFLLYFKIKPILNSVKTATKTVENISTCVEDEVVKPLVQIAAIIQGMRQAVGMVGHFTKGKKGGRDE